MALNNAPFRGSFFNIIHCPLWLKKTQRLIRVITLVQRTIIYKNNLLSADLSNLQAAFSLLIFIERELLPKNSRF